MIVSWYYDDSMNKSENTSTTTSLIVACKLCYLWEDNDSNV